jgi:hydrogenase expression/formation protein HypE
VVSIPRSAFRVSRSDGGEVEEILPLGKLPGALLERLLAQYAPPDERLLVGPGIGRDAAAIALDDERALVVKTDPITFATAEVAWYLVNVNANDLACLGATPRWLLVTALLPGGKTTVASVEALFAGLHAACAPLGIALAGGHTEITHGLDRPILVGTLLGEAARESLVQPGRAQPGDAILVTKGIAIEAVALIAGERHDEVVARYGGAFADRCQAFLHEPGISVVRDAATLRAHVEVRALHDPTEGGLATGLRELARAANLGLVVDVDAIPILPEAARLCADYGLDPLGVIASGALLAAVAPDQTSAAIAALATASISAAAIGHFTATPGEYILRRGGRAEPLPEYAADEITRLYG